MVKCLTRNGIQLKYVSLTWVDVSLADLAALFSPVGELAGLDVRGADRVLLRQGGGLAGVPVPVVIAERLYGEQKEMSQLRVSC